MISRSFIRCRDAEYNCQPIREPYKTMVLQESIDGYVDFIEKKKEKTTLRAGDFSISSLQQVCPDLLKPLPPLPGDNFRSMEGVEDAVSAYEVARQQQQQQQQQQQKQVDENV